MTATGGLARLLEQATPGPWEAEIPMVKWRLRGADGTFVAFDFLERDVSLAALAPDMCRLLLDDRPVIEWAASVACLEPNEEGVSVCEGQCVSCVARSLLARFADLERNAT